MPCANHPDIQAMAACRECARPLCALCVYYREGEAWCREHYEQARGAAPGGLAGEQEAVEATAGADEAREQTQSLHTSADSSISGGPVVRGEVVTPPPAVSFPQETVQLSPQGRPWEADPRLAPMPVEMRPGWTDEQLVKLPGNADVMGLAGTIVGVAAMPITFCCGVAAPLGLVMGLIGGGLSIAALLSASSARNPQQARMLGWIGVGMAVMSVLFGLCMSLLLFGALGTSFVTVP